MTAADRIATLRASAGLPARTDLSLEDARYIDKHAAHVVVRYAGEVPSAEHVQEWLNAASKTEGKELTARTDTMRSHPDLGVLSFVIEKHTTRLPLSAAAEMTQIGGTDKHLDKQSVLWREVESSGGAKILIRDTGTSIEQIVKACMGKLQAATRQFGKRHTSFAEVEASVSYCPARVGDVVDFLASDGAVRRGQVSNLSADTNEVTIQVSSDGKFTVDCGAVHNVVERGAEGAAKKESLLRNYYSAIFPGNPKMAALLTPHSSSSTSDPLKRNIPEEVRVERTDLMMARSNGGAAGEAKKLTLRVGKTVAV